MGSSINSRTEKLFQFFWTAFFIIITIIAMVPILRVISMSFSTKEAILAGKVMVWPVGFTLEAYDRALNSGSFVRAFGYSIVLMIGSTALSLIMTVIAAYPLSKKHLVGGGAIMTLFVLTMYLNPGVIPEYLNVRDFKMIDTVWSLLIPAMDMSDATSSPAARVVPAVCGFNIFKARLSDIEGLCISFGGHLLNRLQQEGGRHPDGLNFAQGE